MQSRDSGTHQFRKSLNYPGAGGWRNSGPEKGHGIGLPAKNAVGSGNGLNHSGSCCDAAETVAEKEKEEEPGSDKDMSQHNPAVRDGGNLRIRSGRLWMRAAPTAGGSPRVRNKRWEAEVAGNEEGTHSSEHDKGMVEAADRRDSEVVEDIHRDCGTDTVVVTRTYPFMKNNTATTKTTATLRRTCKIQETHDRQDVQEPEPLLNYINRSRNNGK